MNELDRLNDYMDQSTKIEANDNELTIGNAKELLANAKDYWSTAHDTYDKDKSFANGVQWDEAMKNQRLRQGRDCQTYNIIPGFIRPLTNAIKEAPPGITIYPAGDGANKDNAKILSGVIRAIEYHSNAQRAYTYALECAAEGGLGAWRVLPKTKKVVESVMKNIPSQLADGSIIFQQTKVREMVEKVEIVIEMINDPTALYWDPTAKLADYSDAGYVIYETVVSARDYKLMYPEGSACNGKEDKVTIWELWQIGKDGFVDFIVFDDYSILVSDKTELTLLPFVLISGKRVEIDDCVEYVSATRDLRACQMEINWLKSEAVSTISSASKALFIADDNALMNPDAWASSATDADAVLYKKPGSEVIPIQPPGPPVGYMELASNNLEMARQISGIYPDPSTQQALSNASGKSIKYQQANSNIQSYHFVEALNFGIKRTGEIVLDQISVYYNDDDIRVAMGIDNTFTPVSIGPNEVPDVQNIDLTNGKYGVVISSGPSYSTQKQALIDQLLEMGRTNPEILPLISDVLVKNINLPGSEELADRFKVMMPPQVQQLIESQDLDGKNPSEIIRSQAIQLQQQASEFQQLQQNAQALAVELEKAKAQEEYKIADLQLKKTINDDNIRSKFAMQEVDNDQQDQMARMDATLKLILAKLNGDNKADIENIKSINKVSEAIESRFD